MARFEKPLLALQKWLKSAIYYRYWDILWLIFAHNLSWASLSSVQQFTEYGKLNQLNLACCISLCCVQWSDVRVGKRAHERSNIKDHFNNSFVLNEPCFCLVAFLIYFHWSWTYSKWVVIISLTMHVTKYWTPLYKNTKKSAHALLWPVVFVLRCQQRVRHAQGHESLLALSAAER